MKVTYTDGSCVEYPGAVQQSDSSDGALIFLLDSAGAVLATFEAGAVKSVEPAV